MNKEPEEKDKQPQKISMQTLAIVGGMALFMLSNKKGVTKLPLEKPPEPIRSEKEIKIRKYIKENFNEDYLYFDEKENYLKFNYHYAITLSQLKDIAEILKVENVIYKSETEKYDGDPYTIIEWEENNE